MLLPDFPSGYGNANFIQIIEFFLMLKPIFLSLCAVYPIEIQQINSFCLI